VRDTFRTIATQTRYGIARPYSPLQIALRRRALEPSDVAAVHQPCPTIATIVLSNTTFRLTSVNSTRINEPAMVEVNLRRPEHVTAEIVVERVRQLHEGTSKTQLIAIDGHGGAGKSTLAHQIADKIESVTIICLDDFSRPSVPGWDQDRFRRQVLNPLLAGNPGRYKRWDWDRDEGAEWHDVPSGRTVIVEGVSSTRTELGAPWDLTIWVDAPESVRLKRGIERDGEELRSMWLEVWIPGENAYVTEQRPQERADLFVDGTG
jgi:uridine kinase